MFSSKTLFYLLSAAAFPLLLGGLLVNGTLIAMYNAWASGEFSPGKACHNVYSGLPIIDHFEAIQVTFWSPIVTEGATRLQAIMLCASLQTAGLWAAIENTRTGCKHWVLRYAPIYCFLWGACGVATLLPIYCHVELTQRARNPDPRIPLAKARAILPALFLALCYPYYLMLFPPPGTTTSQHQSFITLYQFSPFFVYAIIQTFGSCLSRNEDRTAPLDADAVFVKAAYLISGIWSAVTYVTTITVSIFSDRTFSLWRIFMPSLQAVSNATAATHIKEGSFLFMQLDYIIVMAACLIYAVKTLELMWQGGPQKGKALSSNGLVIGMATAVAGLSSLLIGPGATMSAVLYAREGLLRKWKPISSMQVTNGKLEGQGLQ